MNEFLELTKEYWLPILGTIITALAGWIGVVIKQKYTQFVDTKQKEKIVNIVVQGIEQMYQELHGQEKLDKAIEAASEMLEEKGIKITEFELRMLIESAVGGFNKVFENTETVEEIEE